MIRRVNRLAIIGTRGLQPVNTMEFIVRSLHGWAPIAQAWTIVHDDGSLSDPQVEHPLAALEAETAQRP